MKEELLTLRLALEGSVGQTHPCWPASVRGTGDPSHPGWLEAGEEEHSGMKVPSPGRSGNRNLETPGETGYPWEQ